MLSTKHGIQITFSLAVVSVLGPQQASADVVHADDVIITVDLCVGSVDCANGRDFIGDLEVSSTSPEILFFDTSPGSDDWEIEADTDDLSIKHHDQNGSIVEVVELNGGAPANSLVIDSSGAVGFGTATPGKNLHVVGFVPALRFEETVSTSQTWDVGGGNSWFFVRDVTQASSEPFKILVGAPHNSLTIEDTGQIGVGTPSPNLDAGNGIHIQSDADEFAFLGAGVNPAAGGSCAFNIGYGGGAAPGTVFITTRPCGGNEMTRFFVGSTERARADVAGFQVWGSLRVNGTAVNVPDYVFRPGFAIESIEEHADSMWRESHLPALGPAAADGGFEVAKTTMGMLEELEKAHIYIEQLHEQAKQKDERMAALEKSAAESANAMQDVLGRLDALESP